MTAPEFFRYVTCYYILTEGGQVYFLDFHVGREFATDHYKLTTLNRRFAPESWQVERWGEGLPNPGPVVLQNLDRNWRVGKSNKRILYQMFADDTAPAITFDGETPREALITWLNQRPSGLIVSKAVNETSIQLQQRDALINSPGLIPSAGYLQQFVESKYHSGPFESESPERLGVVRAIVAVRCEGSTLKLSHFPTLVQVAADKITEDTRSARVVTVKGTGAYLMATDPGDLDLVMYKSEEIILTFFKDYFAAPSLTVSQSRKLFARRPYELSNGSVLAFRKRVQEDNQ